MKREKSKSDEVRTYIKRRALFCERKNDQGNKNTSSPNVISFLYLWSFILISKQLFLELVRFGGGGTIKTPICQITYMYVAPFDIFVSNFVTKHFLDRKSEKYLKI